MAWIVEFSSNRFFEALSGSIHRLHARSSLRALLMVCALALVLSGCGTNVFGPGGNSGANSANVINIANLVGAPDPVRAALLTKMEESARTRGIPVTTGAPVAGARNVSGYLSAVTESDGTAFSYVWDVFDAAGNRVHRIEGSQKSTERPSDPWLAANETMLASIADSSTASLAVWLSSGGQPPAPGTPAPAGGTTQSSDLRPSLSDPITTGSVQTAAQDRQAPKPIFAAFFPGSNGTGARSASSRASSPYDVALGSFKGAPGNGDQALKKAIHTALRERGIPVVNRGNAPYRVSADITASPPENGREAVAIIWRLEDNLGSEVGTVRQINKVPSGSLDNSWGARADKAAQAAADGIANLMQE